MGRRGCASAMGMIKFPSSCSSPKALCNQFIDYYICSRGVFCINHIKLRNFVVITIECSIATVDRGSIMTRIYRWSMMVRYIRAQFRQPTTFSCRDFGFQIWCIWWIYLWGQRSLTFCVWRILRRSNKATFTHARSGCGAEAGGFWYSRSATAGMFTHTRSGRGRICHFLRTMVVWSARFRSGCGKLVIGPISCGAVFAPAPPPLRDRACVNACNDLCWSQFSARPRPRPPAHVWT